MVTTKKITESNYAASVNTQIVTHTSDTDNPHETTKALVGLENVDNTSDADKPVSTATQAAIDLKANTTDVDTALALKADAADFDQVDNTSDADKPVSTAQQAALDGKANADDVQPVKLNNRSVTFPNADFFVAGALRGAEFVDEAPVGGVVFSINADGGLEVSTLVTSTVRYWWKGDERLAGSPMHASMSTTWESGGTVVRLILAVGVGNDARTYGMTSAGVIFETDYANNVINTWDYSGVAAGLAFGIGESASMRLWCDKNGDGFMQVNGPGGSAVVPVSNVPAGLVRVGVRGSTSAIQTIDTLSVEYDDRVTLLPVDVSPLTGRSPNLLPEDWLDGILTEQASGNFDLGWAPNTGTGTIEVVDDGLKITGPKAIRVRVPAVGDKLSYFLHLKEWLAQGDYVAGESRLTIVEYTSFNSTLATTTIPLAGKPPGDVSGEIVAQPTTGKALMYIGVDEGAVLLVSHPCLAVGEQGFRPVEAASISKLTSDVGVLQNQIQVSNVPVMEDWGVLPDSTPGRNPPGFTGTGESQITRGKFKGCWLVADDGRTTGGSPLDPQVHIISQDYGRKLHTFDSTYLGYTGFSAQGACVDTSGPEDTFRLACSGLRNVRHYDIESNGGEIVASRIDLNNVDGGSIGGTESANGLGYDAVNHRLILTMFRGKDVFAFEGDSSITPRVAATYTGDWTGSNNGNTPDHIWFDDDLNGFFYTIGDNGDPCRILFFDLATETTKDPWPALGPDGLEGSQSPEGLWINKAKRKAWVINDGGFHTNASPALNIWVRYALPPVSSWFGE